MELRPYVDRLHQELTAVAAAGGPDVAGPAERLLIALDPSIRLVLLEALADATGEITSQLDDAVVDVRLRGTEPHFVVETVEAGAADDVPASSPAAAGPAGPAGPADTSGADDDVDGTEATARLTVRLSERLKSQLEAAATAAGQSVNSWIVGAVRHALSWSPDDDWFSGPSHGHHGPHGRGGRGRSPRRFQGWAR